MTGRHFVVGDIHGCVTALKAKLEELGFDYTRDHLHALGDLVDRGSENVEAVRLLNEPWFDSIMGNHEELMLDGGYNHYANGGAWFGLEDLTVQDEMREMVKNLPIARMIVTPTARKIGLVHADLPGNDWDWFMANLNLPRVRQYALWARERVYMENPPAVTGVDAIYFGHTPRKTPQRVGMFNWIDTGCFATGVITVEELT